MLSNRTCRDRTYCNIWVIVGDNGTNNTENLDVPKVVLISDNTKRKKPIITKDVINIKRFIITNYSEIGLKLYFSVASLSYIIQYSF
ncbi:20997_t:CDS:2 [Gigaspora rosea]|nr:20997_t:CDS:2 [Gigaspora rosea]